MVSDEQIGVAVRRARAARPQESVATSMRVAGHESWRQTVVAKVEAGERVLKLSEAVDLADILSCSLAALTGEPDAADTTRAVMELRAVQELVDSRLQALGAG
jgi:hypothetical protein